MAITTQAQKLSKLRTGLQAQGQCRAVICMRLAAPSSFSGYQQQAAALRWLHLSDRRQRAASLESFCDGQQLVPVRRRASGDAGAGGCVLGVLGDLRVAAASHHSAEQVQAAHGEGRGDQEHRLPEGRRQGRAPAAGHPGRHLSCRAQGQYLHVDRGPKYLIYLIYRG
jgi:hypothetical protein